jgi:hypothetical protein
MTSSQKGKNWTIINEKCLLFDVSKVRLCFVQFFRDLIIEQHSGLFYSTECLENKISIILDTSAVGKISNSSADIVKLCCINEKIVIVKVYTSYVG